MLRYNILPVDPTFPPAQIITNRAADILNFIRIMGCEAADVELDGAHAFSVVLFENGLWSICKSRLSTKYARNRK